MEGHNWKCLYLKKPRLRKKDTLLAFLRDTQRNNKNINCSNNQTFFWVLSEFLLGHYQYSKLYNNWYFKICQRLCVFQVSNFLVTINSSINILIYCTFGNKFKTIFLQIFCGRKPHIQTMTTLRCDCFTKSFLVTLLIDAHVSVKFLQSRSPITETFRFC